MQEDKTLEKSMEKSCKWRGCLLLRLGGTLDKGGIDGRGRRILK